MKLCICKFALACGIVWALGILFVGVANLIWPPYGEAFLTLISSIYPGYHHAPTFGSILVGTGYGLVDGLVCGAVLASIYNGCCGSKCCCKAKECPPAEAPKA